MHDNEEQVAPLLKHPALMRDEAHGAFDILAEYDRVQMQHFKMLETRHVLVEKDFTRSHSSAG